MFSRLFRHSNLAALRRPTCSRSTVARRVLPQSRSGDRVHHALALASIGSAATLIVSTNVCALLNNQIHSLPQVAQHILSKPLRLDAAHLPVLSFNVNERQQQECDPDHQLISYDEVQTHNGRHSCWVVIDGQVWDVTSLLPNHPGGTNAILDNAGTDVSFVIAYRSPPLLTFAHHVQKTLPQTSFA